MSYNENPPENDHIRFILDELTEQYLLYIFMKSDLEDQITKVLSRQNEEIKVIPSEYYLTLKDLIDIKLDINKEFESLTFRED